ncbi:uncharacterized protein [Epargyreus clarus]|uniref:uncharacterized protein n=1 Tax=Epargyreus clarus TaxID=520877 RepID=UPI003C2FC2A7
MRKRKREDEDTLSKAEIMDMFTALTQDQESRFMTIMKTMTDGIRSHTEQNDAIRKSIDFLGQKYDELVNKVHKLEEERSADRKHILSLEAKIEYFEKTLRSSTIEIRNVPKTAPETKNDLIELVQKVGQTINAPLQTTDIRDVYRINSQKDTNKTIVAELSSVTLRDKFIGSCRTFNKKNGNSKLSTSHLQISGPRQPVYISEYLTIHTKKLFHQAREHAKSNNYKYCWTSRGKVYIRRSDGAPVIKINDSTDLDKILRQ